MVSVSPVPLIIDNCKHDGLLSCVHVYCTLSQEHLADSGYDKIQFTLVDCPGHASLIKTVLMCVCVCVCVCGVCVCGVCVWCVWCVCCMCVRVYVFVCGLSLSLSLFLDTHTHTRTHALSCRS